MMRSLAPGLMLLLLVFAPGLHAQTPAPPVRVVHPFLSVLFQADYETGTPPDIRATDGWRVVEQRGGRMFCISNYRSQYGFFPNFLFGSEDWENYSVEAQIQLTGRETGHAAILTRLDNNWWGYRHRIFFDFWGMGMAQYYYGGPDGTESQILGVLDLTIESGKWYMLRAEVEGKTVRTVVNGWAIAHYNVDKNIRGFAGIEVGPGARLCVDNVIVRSLDRSPRVMSNIQRASANRNANVRLYPGLTYDRVGVLREGEEIFVLDWNEDRTWVYIRKSRTYVQGWVRAEFVDLIIPPTPPAPVS